MKILCVNCIVSDFGGVEFAAMNLARGLARRGHEVHFLGAAGAAPQLRPADKTSENLLGDGPRIQFHFAKFPRIYPLGEKHGAFQKMIWHLQDILHPANEKIFSAFLDQIQPDVILLHNITVIGLNIWRPIAKAGIPCLQVVHDLSPVCMNMSQFRGGKPCHGLCTPCFLQKQVRFRFIKGASNFAFVSPSNATLGIVERYESLSNWQRAVIPNANTFVVRDQRIATEIPELLYVGRLDPAKGVGSVLQAAERASHQRQFVVHVLGAGSEEQILRETYARAPWVKFHGNVSQEEIADRMARSALLLIPSLWSETVPGVAIHALYAGLPVLGARIGGIPEHVFDGETGLLLPPGDVVAWAEAIDRVLGEPERLQAWSRTSLEKAGKFDAELAVSAYERLMLKMLADKAGAS